MTAIAIIDRGLVALAVLIALPTVLGDLYAVLALPKGKSGSTHVLARLFRFLDMQTGYRMTPASYLATDYLLVRLAWEVASSSMPLSWRLSIVAVIAATAIVLMYPLLAIYNAVGSLLWRNPPLDLDKQRYFPGSARLEDPKVFAALRREIEVVLAQDQAGPITDVYQNLTIIEARGDAPKTSGAGAVGWRSFFLRVADRDIAANLARMPTLAAVLREMPEAYNVLLSILDPGHDIVPHRGYFKGILRYHLGVVVPSPGDATLTCGGQRYQWREGAGVLFDDMFVHSVENRCVEPRVVLYLDIRRRPLPLFGLVTNALFWLVTHHPYHRGVRARAAAR